MRGPGVTKVCRAMPGPDYAAFLAELEERGLTTVAREICLPFHVRIRDLRRGPAERQQPTTVVAECRSRLATYLHDRGWSYPDIAALLGYGSHASVMYLVGAAKLTAERRAELERRRARFAHVPLPGSLRIRAGPHYAVCDHCGVGLSMLPPGERGTLIVGDPCPKCGKGTIRAE